MACHRAKVIRSVKRSSQSENSIVELEALFKYSLQTLLFPPGINIVLLILGWLLWQRARAVAMTAIGISVFTLYAFSMPWMANRLMGSLQPYPPLQPYQMMDLPAGSAIVILGGGRNEKAEEYGGIDTVGTYSLERLRYGSYLAKKLNLPILVTGGTVFGEATPEAVLMNQSLIEDFNVTPKWLESESHTTAENAIFSARVLKTNKIENVFLVSHAWHLPRAVAEFEKQGLKVTPAPLGFISDSELRHGPLPYLPSSAALHISKLALREQVGRVWYKLIY